MYSQIAANKRKTILLILFFIALVTGLSWLFAEYVGTPSITLAVLLGASVYALIMYFSASRVATLVNGAHPIQKRDNPRLYRIVENLAITEGLPTPKIYMMEDSGLNAFATGRDPNNAVICATTGLLNTLDDQELEGVMAHEMGHIKNYDIRVTMIVFGLVAVIGLLADIMLRMAWFGDNRDRNNNSIFFVLAIVAAILAPLIATLVQLAVSRKREYLADATGALTTRFPQGLASALRKIKLHGSKTRRPNTATAHLFFANPLGKHEFANLFSTHPSVDERIKRLEQMENQV